MLEYLQKGVRGYQMPIAKETLTALKDNRHKLTPQRKAILRVLTASQKHLTIEEIFTRVVRRNPRISLVTVYRTLNILTELGLACEVSTGANSKSYVAGNPEPHGHLICTGCGKVVDFENNLDDLVMKLAADSDYSVRNYRLDLYGICPECAQLNRVIT